MISKLQSNEERTFLDRATLALRQVEDHLWVLSFMLKNDPALRRVIEDQIENNNDLIEEIEEAKDKESEEYKKSA